MRLIRIRRADRPAFQDRVAGLETLATYPLGDDRFQIDHGADYWAFFDRLGETVFYAWVDADQVVCVAALIRRDVAFRAGETPRRVWYSCDLKVHPDRRGRRLPLRMLRRKFLVNYLRCPRAYGITMNPPSGENRVVRLASHWRLSPIRAAATLELFSLDAEQMSAAQPTVARHRGPVSYLSLRGVKDIVLQSTGAPMPLLHLQHGAAPADPGTHRVDAPQPEHVHMLCSPVGDPLNTELAAAGFVPSATATVLSHRMPTCDWRFVLTSDI